MTQTSTELRRDAHPDREVLARRAFEAIADLQQVDSLGELDRVVRPVFENIGCTYFATAQFFRPDRSPCTEVLFGSFHAGWAERYVRHNYSGRSGIAGEMLVSAAPYSWNDVLGRRDLSAEARRIWNEARDYRLSDGLFAPMRGPDGSYAAVALSGEHIDTGDRFLRVVAQVLCGFYGGEGRRIATKTNARAVLTPRQRECLAWVRQGKSSNDIADLLTLSTPTVDAHIADACRRLGVRTRVQAVVEAVGLGLLPL
jgi:DNA-binding CsgD family transcriptional regulator